MSATDDASMRRQGKREERKGEKKEELDRAQERADEKADEVADLERRLFLRKGLSLGALALLGGCSPSDDEGVQRILAGMSRWNDGVQDWLFDPKRLAPEFPESMITRPFPLCVICTAWHSGLRSRLPVLPAFGRSETSGDHFDPFLSPWKLKPSWIDAGRSS